VPAEDLAGAHAAGRAALRLRAHAHIRQRWIEKPPPLRALAGRGAGEAGEIFIKAELSCRSERHL
jgi:hypothetical protein